MCGIAGWMVAGRRAPPESVLRCMTDAIAHRGPDGEGSCFIESGDFQIGLGHRRLAIIDPVGGVQPMHVDSGLTLIFNGEIYNFREVRAELEAAGCSFRTDSDTEVVLQAYDHWGDKMLGRLRGMFAFALWDEANQRLLLARDRFGKKPLFFYDRGDGDIYFASEIKAFKEVPGFETRVNTDAVWHYFSYRYVPAPATLYQGVRKLMPGTYAVWQNGRLEETRYYTPPDREPIGSAPLPADPVAGFLELLEESTRLRMVSDVPFGAFLSGGIDSSAVVAFMSRHSNLPVKTFSVGFKETQYSELRYAKAIAELYKTEHHELTVTHQEMIDALPLLVHHRDGPVSEPSDIPIYLLSKEAEKTVKMVLTGEGSDEMLGGYPKHVFERYIRFYQSIPRFARKSLIAPLINGLPYRFRRAKTAIQNLGIECDEERMSRWFGALSDDERRELVALPPPTEAPSGPEYQFDTPRENSPLRKILYFDQTSWLPDNLLERGDRMTMAASIEARMPFMDHVLAEYVSSLPDKYRVHGRTTKYLLREGMKRVLPREILERSKIGFRAPVNEWFRGPMREYLVEHLQGSGSLTRHYYHAEALDRKIDEHLRGRQNHEKLLWALLNLEVWHRQNIGPQ
jgi:asparagine synthase (glutamine-hydrolysing)